MVVLAAGAVAVVLLLGSGGDSTEDKQPCERGRSATPTPSLSLPSELLPDDLPTGGLPGELPTELPDELPTAVPSELESLFP